MKKIISVVAILAIALVAFSGCTKTKSYTYEVETGDRIKIEIDATKGYDLTSKLPFKIKKGNKALTQGIFLTMENYNKYLEGIETNSKVEVLDKGTKKDMEYIFYLYNDEEYNYLIKVKGTKTGVLLSNTESKKSAEECFKRVTISEDED